MVEPHLTIRELNVWYGSNQVLRNISFQIPSRCITAIIGPSGCGKTTLLKCLNRLLEEDPQVRVTGNVYLNNEDIYSPSIDVIDVRTRIGLLAPKPFPLPMSIFDNVAFGPRIHGRVKGKQLEQLVEHHLQAAGLWGEVNNRLHKPATQLSTGQQQRLCLARALAVEPEVLLCDEATSALDPISAQRVENQLQALRQETTIVVVTHLLRQAHRLADYLVFLWMGELVEAGPAQQLFEAPCDERTRAYLAGDIG